VEKKLEGEKEGEMEIQKKHEHKQDETFRVGVTEEESKLCKQLREKAWRKDEEDEDDDDNYLWKGGERNEDAVAEDIYEETFREYYGEEEYDY
jgi:hypothetical protein